MHLITVFSVKEVQLHEVVDLWSLTIGIVYIGTLDGFTFDSDGEGDRLHELHASQNDQNNENEDQPKEKTKRKAAAKPAVWFLAYLSVALIYFRFTDSWYSDIVMSPVIHHCVC
jgi:hypothetical protein